MADKDKIVVILECVFFTKTSEHFGVDTRETLASLDSMSNLDQLEGMQMSSSLIVSHPI